MYFDFTLFESHSLLSVIVVLFLLLFFLADEEAGLAEAQTLGKRRAVARVQKVELPSKRARVRETHKKLFH